MKKQKLFLSTLKIRSFVTDIAESRSATIKGGSVTPTYGAECQSQDCNTANTDCPTGPIYTLACHTNTAVLHCETVPTNDCDQHLYDV